MLNAITGVANQYLELITSRSWTVDIEFFVESGRLHRWHASADRFERYTEADCTGATDPDVSTGDVRWVGASPPSPGIIIPSLRLVVTGQIQPPESQINPPAETAVNLGLWLAVTDPGPIVAEGRLGPLWARGTATLTSTTFDPGNGDPHVVCDGAGTPITDLDTIEQGPCGYTYRTLTDVRNDDLQITIHSTWTITWETSDGNGSADPPETMIRTTTIPYEVYEITTVGVSN